MELGMGVKLLQNFYGYIYLDASVDEAVKLLEGIRKELNANSEDLNDTLRILANFQAFYQMIKKRFKEFITPRKSESDLIYGRVVIEKIKLYREGGQNRVTIVFDKRFRKEDLVRVLNVLGIDYSIEEAGDFT
jgi:uridine kinase